MNKSELIAGLNESYNDFSSYISSLSEAQFTFSLNGEKWSAGQQIDHLCRSVAPLNRAFDMPGLALQMMFGKAKRPSRSYDETVARYKAKLADGGVATGRFVPQTIGFGERENLVAKLENSVSKLCRSVEKYDEQRLDDFVLPHPLLGKIALREMLCFTIYHAKHHHAQTRQNLDQRNAP